MFSCFRFSGSECLEKNQLRESNGAPGNRQTGTTHSQSSYSGTNSWCDDWNQTKSKPNEQSRKYSCESGLNGDSRVSSSHDIEIVKFQAADVNRTASSGDKSGKNLDSHSKNYDSSRDSHSRHSRNSFDSLDLRTSSSSGATSSLHRKQTLAEYFYNELAACDRLKDPAKDLSKRSGDLCIIFAQIF